MPQEINWDELERLWEEQTTDGMFRELGSTLVPGEGDNPIAFIIGGAPSAQETANRRPFTGPAGRVQRQLMSFAGLHVRGPWFTNDEPPSNCWLTNAIKFRPPRNRKPYWVELMGARPYLQREWRAVGAPRLLITVGETALSVVLGRQTSVSSMLGKTIYRPPLALWPMVDPAFGLRQPAMQDIIERDWERLAQWRRDGDYSS